VRFHQKTFLHKLGPVSWVPLLAAAAAAGASTEAALLIGGAGSVYFLGEPGELVVEVEKRNRNRRDAPTELRAILAGPDRRVLQEATIPDGEPVLFRPMGEPVLISRRCIGLASHSGMPASVVSRGSKVHVVWGEATDPKVKAAGVPLLVLPQQSLRPPAHGADVPRRGRDVKAGADE